MCPPAPSSSSLRRPVFWLLLILGLGAGLRLVALDRIPPGDWYDEAINGLDALDILEKPGWPLFFDTEGHPREPIYMYCVAGMVWLLGPTATSLRATSVVIAILTLWVVWLWAREIAGDRRALLVVLALALMRWHLHFSRLSFRTNLTPLFLALLLWAVWRLARTRRPAWAVVAGLVLGLGFSTYLSFRVAPVLLAAVAIHAGWRRRREADPIDRIDPVDPIDQSAPSDLPGPQCAGSPPGPSSPSSPSRPFSPFRPSSPRRLAALFILSCAVGLLPTAIDAVQHPDHLLKRAGEVTPFSEGLGPGVVRVAAQARDVALMFFVRGDHVPKHNIAGGIQWFQLYGWHSPGMDEALERQEADRAARAAGQPLPDPHGHGLPVFDPLAALFLGIGLVALFARIHRDTAAFSILAWMALIGMTSVLSFGAPNYLRTLGMVPAVAFTLVEGLDWSRRRVELRWGRGVAIGLVAVFFLHFGVIEAKRYFIDWPAHPLTWRDFNTEFAELARFVRTVPDDTAFQVPDYIRTHPTFAFETHGRKGLFGFGAEGPPAAATDREEGSGRFAEWWVIAPLPPYPPAPVPRDWLENRRPLQVLLRPDDQPWALVLPGPAPGENSGGGGN